MATSKKYTPATINTILAALSQTGSDRIAIAQAEIDRTTYYEWLRKNPEFAEKVKAAKQEYRDRLTSSDTRLIDLAHAQILKLLENGASETWESNSVEGELNGTTEIPKHYSRTQKRVSRHTPSWVLDRVMGPAGEAIELLAYLFLNEAIADGERITVARYLRRAAPLLDAATKEAIAAELESANEANA